MVIVAFEEQDWIGLDIGLDWTMDWVGLCNGHASIMLIVAFEEALQ